MQIYPTTNVVLVCKHESTRGKVRLGKSFRPGPFDTICARGKDAYDHEGNKRFRALIKKYQSQYAQVSSCKVLKSKIVSQVVDTVRAASPEGGFVKRIDGVWYEVGDRCAKEKVGQSFRDGLHTIYSSSTKAKARVRQMRRRNDDSDDSEDDEQSITDAPVPMKHPSSSSPLVRRRRSTSVVSDSEDSSVDLSDNDNERRVPSPPSQQRRVSIEIERPEELMNMPLYFEFGDETNVDVDGLEVFGCQKFHPIEEEKVARMIQPESCGSLENNNHFDDSHDDCLDILLEDVVLKQDFCDVMGVAV